MSYFYIFFVLGIINLFYAGINAGVSLQKKKQGLGFEIKDFLFVLVPFSLGVYFLLNMFFYLGSECIPTDYD
jgi:hypothetical protein